MCFSIFTLLDPFQKILSVGDGPIFLVTVMHTRTHSLTSPYISTATWHPFCHLYSLDQCFICPTFAFRRRLIPSFGVTRTL